MASFTPRNIPCRHVIRAVRRPFVGTLGESLSDPFRGSLIPSGRLLICRVVELLLELLSTTLSRVLDSLPPVLMTPDMLWFPL